MITADSPSSHGLTTAVSLTKSVKFMGELHTAVSSNIIPSILLMSVEWYRRKRQWLYRNPVTTLLSITNTLMINNNFSHLLLVVFTLFVTLPKLKRNVSPCFQNFRLPFSKSHLPTKQLYLMLNQMI